MTFTPEQAALRDEAAQVNCADWAAQQGWPLKRAGTELVGPCPKCGGSDRFSMNPARNVWNCRGCGVGGDVIYLVCHTEDLGFLAACERLVGRSAAAPVDPAHAAALAEARARQEADRDREAQRYREKARNDARSIWTLADRIVGLEPSPSIADYLQLRGLGGGSIDFAAPDWALSLKLPIRTQRQRAYWHDGAVLYTGLAMIAAIQFPDGRFAGVHQTWIDLDAPKGKQMLVDGKGEPLPSKKVLGIKKGCVIRLLTPEGAHRMVMGEGIETTMTALVHAREPGTAYWAGVDLGNMAGKALRGPTGGQIHDQPDMDDTGCFAPPDWVTELVFLCDGDEATKHTVEKVTRGLRRARRRREAMRAAGAGLAPLTIKMVPPGAAGTDLNSLAMAELDDDGRGGGGTT